MKTVKDLLLDAVFFDNHFLAYSVYIAVQKNIVTMNDDENKFYASDLPFEEIRQALDSDSLLLEKNSIKLFMVKYYFDYAIYLGKSRKEIEQLHFKLFKEPPELIVEATHKKHTSVYDELTKRTWSFYDMQEPANSFPLFCGLMESKPKRKAG